MDEGEKFEAISNPLRIKILKLLSKKSMSFSELKRYLGIRSSGKLDFHLKKLEGLVALDKDGKYTLTKDGYAALQAIETVRKYGWQRRAYLIATVAYVAALIYTLNAASWELTRPVHGIALLLMTLWYIYYSYVSIVKRGVFKST